MYAKRTQLINYGPIEKLDIEFPFEDDVPRPVILVGENGSGKSILLSHIVNGLVSAKGVAYPDAPEVEAGRVYKLRSASYIRSGSLRGKRGLERQLGADQRALNGTPPIQSCAKRCAGLLQLKDRQP